MGEIKSEKLDLPEVKPVLEESVYQTIPFSDFQTMDIPKPKKLVGDIVLLNDLTFLFGYNGRGKSIDAFHFSVSVALGIDLDLGNGVILENECEPMNVVYFDYELKPVQVKDRLGEKKFPSNLYRSSLLRGKSEGNNPTEIFHNIVKEAEKVYAKFIVIDNMQKISSIDLSNGKEVKTFLEPMHKLCMYEGYTILIVAHTTLEADSFIPLEKKHLFGSSYIVNYADAITGIGMVNSDKNEFYLKQLKTRVLEDKYGKTNVIRYTIAKDELFYTTISSSGTCHEQELLNGNVSINIERAPKRPFFTILFLYHDSNHRTAQKKLAEIGITESDSTIYNNAMAFKGADSKTYNTWISLSKDEQKALVDFHNPYPDIDFLPLAKGHVPKSNDEDEIPF
jgi:hypothetical protein